MNPELQSWAALLVVLLAVVALVGYAWRQRRKPGCGGQSCACPTQDLKRARER